MHESVTFCPRIGGLLITPHLDFGSETQNWGRSIVISICLFVCLSVCLSVREHIFGTTCPIFTNFLCILPMVVHLLSFDGVTYVMGWLGSRVVSVLDLGPVFKSQPRRCRVTLLSKLFTPIVPLFTKQRNRQQPSSGLRW